MRAELRSHVQPYSSDGAGHQRTRHCAQHATRCRASCARIQPAQGAQGRVSGGPLPRHGGGAYEHLHRGLIYIDLNMVRAGLVTIRLSRRMVDIGKFKIRPSATV